MKYKKKPVIIEAVQWTGKVFSEYPEWIKEAKRKQPKEAGAIRFDVPPSSDIDMPDSYPCFITTLEGTHVCSPNDFVIRGVQGELYPCKPDIFEKTYEQVP